MDHLQNRTEKHYTIGLDFGSLSCRGVLVDTGDGEIAAQAESVYAHGVLDHALPSGEKLPPLWALQDPQDYLDAMEAVVSALLRESHVQPEQVIALGLDTTASTVIPVDRQLSPLCRDERFRRRPHAWPKLWKHHAALREAERITEQAKRLQLPAVERYGGAVGSEFYICKVVQAFFEDREIFDAAATFFEQGDWLASLLTGTEVRSASYLSGKAMWDEANGYPPRAFFAGLHEDLAELPREKLAYHAGTKPVIAWPGQPVGRLCASMAKRLGLTENTVVTAPQLDAYAGLPGCGIDAPDSLMMMIGTSTGYMLLGEEYKPVPGICGATDNSILPGFVCYSAGQAGVGDLFGWFVENGVPAAYAEQARATGQSVHQVLTELAAKNKPGESGLLALDWLNGNKSCLNNSQLSGLVLGMNLRTKPEHIYRAFIEATAFGARKIVENFEAHGIAVKEIVTCGGIAQKNALLMQIYADVLKKPLRVCPSEQTAALGSAVYAAAAAGTVPGGHESLNAAIRAMTDRGGREYRPIPENSRVYDVLYGEYIRLHDYFGTGENNVMMRLNDLRV